MSFLTRHTNAAASVLRQYLSGGCVPISKWAPNSQRGWSAVVGIRQVDGDGVLLEVVGLDELLLGQCPGGECQ
jgi:hypothetical protein